MGFVDQVCRVRVEQRHQQQQQQQQHRFCRGPPNRLKQVRRHHSGMNDGQLSFDNKLQGFRPKAC